MPDPKKLLLLILFTSTVAWGAKPPFNRGINLTQWFETRSPEQIQFSEYTKQDIINIQNLGCDVLRLPINLHAMTEGAPFYTVSPLLFSYLDQVVDWAEDLGIYLIIDNHSFDWAGVTDPNIGEILFPVWKQVADRYKSRSGYILYEVLNEPHGIEDSVWNIIQQQAVDTIRSVDSIHTIVVGGAGWNGFYDLELLPSYSDNNLIYTFHFYEPYLFTLQGVSEITPSQATLTGVPFPYDPARMPAVPPVLAGTWVEDEINTNYQVHGTVPHMKELLDIAVNFKNDRNVPLLCGEFGPYRLGGDSIDREAYCQALRSYLEVNDIAWTMWDYFGGNLFENDNCLFDYDLNIPMLEALGLDPPSQQDYTFIPDSVGFKIFGDTIAQGFYEDSWISNGKISYLSDDNTAVGSKCIYWGDPDRYNRIDFKLRPLKDLSYLKDHGYALDFWMRTDSPGAIFDIRFLDSETSYDDHPWRMITTIDMTDSTWDENWHHYQIPLSDFSEEGSWDNDTWYDPVGLFDWTRVDHFQIVAEHQSLINWQLWFDDIQITNAVAGTVTSRNSPVIESNTSIHNYPNPFNATTSISYNLEATSYVNLQIFDQVGQSITTLVDNVQSAGSHQVEWNAKNTFGNNVTSGLYYYRLVAGESVGTGKMILAR